MMITDNGCVPHNCNACKYHYAAQNYHFKMKGVDNIKMDGFICAAFAAEEGIMTYMSGLISDSVDFCEMFTPRGEK